MTLTFYEDPSTRVNPLVEFAKDSDGTFRINLKRDCYQLVFLPDQARMIELLLRGE